MRVVLPGGSGQLGRILARAFGAEGHEVVVLSRRPRPGPWCCLGWDGRSRGRWWAALEGADLLVNLTGQSVNCRYGARNRRRILGSRTDSVRALAEAVRGVARPPHTWLQMSTATIYDHSYGTAHDETSERIAGAEPDAPESWRFSIDVATAWERTFDEAELPNTRKVTLRSAVVMSPDRGGPFDVLLGLVRRGLGGRAGDGRQYVSWIHHEDFARAVAWIAGRDSVDGRINLASPNPLPNAGFMAALRAAWGTRLGLPATPWMLEIGAWLMRTETELVLKSRRVVPGRLLESGFEFRHPDWPEAARQLCAAWRAGPARQLRSPPYATPLPGERV